MIFDEETFDLEAFSEGEVVASVQDGWMLAYPQFYLETDRKDEEWLIVVPSLL